MDIKGKLIIIGGAVDKGSFAEKNFNKDSLKNLNFFEEGILRRILKESKRGEDSVIEVVTTASTIPEEVGEEYIKAFNHLGAQKVNVLNIQNREEAEEAKYLKRVRQSDVVMFTGGNQLRLSSILGGTKFHKILLEKYQREDFLLSGTSAGAAAASRSMIYQGGSKEALMKGEIKITAGLGFIDGVIVDTHFVKRGRIGRLFQAVVTNPMVLGIGLGEDTGLLIKKGFMMEAIGSGLVILVDGKQIRNTDLTDVAMGEPISIEKLVVHVLSKGDTFNLQTGKMVINSWAKRKETVDER